tara:strand:+ start:1174 stop:2988 length:1815 start_codon:yes stop_codon:yes gene_type:complete
MMSLNLIALAQQVLDLNGAELRQLSARDGVLYWLEENDHTAFSSLMSYQDHVITKIDVPFDICSRVNEYGGGELHVGQRHLYVVNASDQQIYAYDAALNVWLQFTKRTDARFTDMFEVAEGLLAVQELHQHDQEPEQSIVLIKDQQIQTVVSGADFYAAPTVSPDGRQLAFLTWSHPDMPWDECRLQVGQWINGRLRQVQCMNAGAMEVISQYEWTNTSQLLYTSDRSGYASMYCQGQLVGATTLDFGYDRWQFGGKKILYHSSGLILGIEGPPHQRQLGRFIDDKFVSYEIPFVDFGPWIVEIDDQHIACVAFHSDRPECLIQINILDGSFKRLFEQNLDLWTGPSPAIPEYMIFETAQKATSHAFYYPPKAGEHQLCPLIVISHGGPTTHTTMAFHSNILFWNALGYGVLDVNYRGSTGYGRAYQNQLKHQWGVVDVEDCVHAVQHLVRQKRVDPDRCAIRGKSSGGLTTLNALIFHDCFKVGASYFGVTDLEDLIRITHKFEKYYLDYLIGPYPKDRKRYRERSPKYLTHRLKQPVIFFQGDLDQVVPPSQSKGLVSAMKKQNLIYEYHEYAGERHGFKQTKHKLDSLVREVTFFNTILDV